jgi:DNA-binding NtrC family response regulator
MLPSKSILVVDTDVNVGQSLAMILEQSGFTVTQAHNACQTLEMMQGQTFDLVCLDIIQPDMDVGTLLAAILNSNPQILGLIITAYPEISSLVTTLCPIKWGYFLKPVDPVLLLARVKKMLDAGQY